MDNTLKETQIEVPVQGSMPRLQGLIIDAKRVPGVHNVTPRINKTTKTHVLEIVLDARRVEEISAEVQKAVSRAA